MSGKRKISFALIITIAFSGFLNAETTEIDWKPLGKAVELAKKDGKPVYVYLFRNGCGWCKKFKNKTLAKSEIIEQLSENFYSCQLNSSSTKKQEFNGEKLTEGQLAAMFAVRGVPTSAFLDSDGKIIAKLPGFMSSDQFLNVLKYIGKGWYKDMTYQEFLESEDKLKK